MFEKQMQRKTNLGEKKVILLLFFLLDAQKHNG